MSNNKVDHDSSDDEEDLPPPLADEKVEEVAEDTTLANSDVTTKHQEAGKIAQDAIETVAKLCVPGASVRDLCVAGDKFITDKCSSIYRGKNKAGKPIEKGIAFPVCVSVNDCIAHCSPLASDDSFPALKADDIVKIDLGVHIDGYIAVVAHSVFVGRGAESPVETGVKADVVNAAWNAAKICCKMIRPGNSNKDVTNAILKVAETYGVKTFTGTHMHQMKRYVIDASKTISLGEEVGSKTEECKFEAHEVWTVDIYMSSGEGKARQQNARTTVFKRQVDTKYALKNKASRAFLNEVNKAAPTMPFSLRMFPDEKSAKLGLPELVSGGLVSPYPVYYEREGDIVVHTKVTVLVMNKGNNIITGCLMPTGFNSDKVLSDELMTILNSEDKKDKKKKKDKK